MKASVHDAPGPVRSCVGCRTRHPAASLIQLQVDDSGALTPNVQRGRRSAWVCPQNRCVSQIQRNPRGLYRALRHKPAPCTKHLQQRLLDHLDTQLQDQLVRCHRSGLIVSGRHAIQQTVDLSALLVAADASQESLRQIQTIHPSLVCLYLPWNRLTLGQLIRRGERSFIGLRPGRYGVLFREGLQRRANLS